MKIGTIFEIINKALLSVRWEHECEDSFKLCFNLWQDIEYLEEFFEQYKLDLRSDFWQLNVEDAVFLVVKGAKETAFRRIQTKAYGASMLRMYAVRLGSNCYIVTGGAIKLTKTMQERPHTALELKKLECVAAYLKTNGIDDESDYGFIEIENK